MAGLTTPRRFLKLFHPEAIPWPGSLVYNAISGTTIFQRTYDVLARDILTYCDQGRILDVGTGPGWLLMKLHRLSPRVQPVGIDSSPSMIAKAEKNVADAGLSDAVEVKEGNAACIPYPDESFDAVVSTGSIHHWKDPTTCLNEVYRVLKPGGYALMYDIMSDTPAPVLEESRREFGRLRTLLCWLHSFEEPFYSRSNFELLAAPTLFRTGQTRFVGVLCCLILRKEGRG